MRKGYIRWLYGQLDEWMDRGIIDREGSDRLRELYGPAERVSGRRMAVTICSILGGLLIGGGIILLLGHNWQQLSRPVRTVLALLPVLAGQAGVLAAATVKRESVAWREGATTFLCLAIGASIALVGQTYHLPGDTADFLLTWGLLALPLVYIARASLPAFFYLALIMFWAGYVQSEAGHALLFWPLFGLVLPHIWIVSRKTPYSNRAALLGWGVCLCLCIGTGIAMEKSLPGLWVIVYAALFACMYLAGNYWVGEGGSFGQRPLQNVGACGVAVLALMLTLDFAWHRVGWNYYHYGYRYHRVAEWVDYALGLVLPSVAVALTVMAARRRQLVHLLFGIMPILAVAAYGAAALMDQEWPAMLIFNLYVFVLSLAVIVAGIRRGRIGTVNGGMLILTALILMRFFDEDLGFLARGIAFILLGSGFLATNLVLARLWKGGR